MDHLSTEITILKKSKRDSAQDRKTKRDRYRRAYLKVIPVHVCMHTPGYVSVPVCHSSCLYHQPIPLHTLLLISLFLCHRLVALRFRILASVRFHTVLARSPTFPLPPYMLSSSLLPLGAPSLPLRSAHVHLTHSVTQRLRFCLYLHLPLSLRSFLPSSPSASVCSASSGFNGFNTLMLCKSKVGERVMKTERIREREGGGVNIENMSDRLVGLNRIL